METLNQNIRLEALASTKPPPSQFSRISIDEKKPSENALLYPQKTRQNENSKTEIERKIRTEIGRKKSCLVFIKSKKSAEYLVHINQAKNHCQESIKQIDKLVSTINSGPKLGKEAFKFFNSHNFPEKKSVRKLALKIRNSTNEDEEAQKYSKVYQNLNRKIKSDKFDFNLTISDGMILVTLYPSRSVENFSFKELIEKTIDLFKKFYEKNKFDVNRMTLRFKELIQFETLNAKEMVWSLFFLDNVTLNINPILALWKNVILGIAILKESKKNFKRSFTVNHNLKLQESPVDKNGTQKEAKVWSSGSKVRKSLLLMCKQIKSRKSQENDHELVRAYAESPQFIENLKLIFFVYTQLLNWEFAERFKSINRIMNFKSVIKDNVDVLNNERKNLTTHLSEMQKIIIEKNYHEFSMPVLGPEKSIFDFTLKHVLEVGGHQGFKYSEFYLKNRDELFSKFGGTLTKMEKIFTVI